MADGKITIDTELNNKGLDEGLRNVKNKVNKTSKDLNKGAKAVNGLKTAFNETGGAAAGFASKMGSVASSGGGVAVAITAAVMAAKKYIETLKAANEAYKVQIKAEKALQKAAENNPYLNRESVQRLKDYASELQSVSNYGDEGTIDVMAQLASTGRTEAEIMKIMGAAADYAAAKHIDLRTAAETLNSTYSGMAGTMGRQIADIKDLTDEQLKNGDAIDLIAQKYKGFAKEAADSSTQAKNAFGDFMESVGKIAHPTFEALNQQAKSFWEGMTAQMSKFNNALETKSRTWRFGGIKRGVDEGVKTVNAPYTNKTTGEEKRGASFQTKEYLEWLKQELELRGELNDEEKTALIEITYELNYRERVAKNEQKQAEAAAKRNAENKKALEIQATADDEAQKHIDSVTKALAEQLEAMRVNAELRGEEVDTAEEMNAYMNAYVDLVVKSNGLVTENNTVAKNMLGTIEEMAKVEAKKTKSLKEQAELEEATKNFYDFLGDLQDDLSEIDFFKNQVKELEKRKDDAIKLKNLEADEKLKIEKEFAEAKAKLDEKITQLEKEQQRERIDNYINLAVEFANEYANAMNNITRLASEGVEARSYLSTKEAEKMYNDGEIGYEEYQEKLADIEKESAKQRHKIAMWEWGVQLVQAIANTAQGITKAIAQGGVAGVALGALVGAAGAAQIALITANKPVLPSFATGGIVGGTSYTGDNVLARLNSGEMVFTYAQQKRLLDIADGGRSGGNVQVFNSASNDVNVRPEITPEGVRILIRKVVNEDMASGRYNRSYKQMRGGLNGVRLTN